MMLFHKKKIPVLSPVLVVDALGFTQKLISSEIDELHDLGGLLERQYYRFRAKVPHKLVVVFKDRVWGSNDFRTFSLNDMFILHFEKKVNDAPFKFLVASSLLYQSMLLEGFIPRGGLGFGPLLRRSTYLIGSGFIDAFVSSEKRDDRTRNVCAIQISRGLFDEIPRSEKAYRLLCRYNDEFFLHPTFLTDPEFGPFDNDRILNCLRQSGANDKKLDATRDFLQNLEDFDTALTKASGRSS